MEGLLTWRAFPQRGLVYPDPFLLLNHHGPQEFPTHNDGLPFGPHPHRGFETLTFIRSGELLHADSLGQESISNEGGVQWMTAGSGLIHAEVSSRDFKRNGGKVEILQLWMNLPASLKFIAPRYQGFPASQIPRIQLDENGSELRLIAGQIDKLKGPAISVTGLFISELHLSSGAEVKLCIPDNRSILVYAVSGMLELNGVSFEKRQTAVGISQGVSDKEEGSIIHFSAKQQSVLIFGHGIIIAEPVASYGPFVMNTDEEIHEAINDYRIGKMGTLNLQKMYQ